MGRVKLGSMVPCARACPEGIPHAKILFQRPGPMRWSDYQNDNWPRLPLETLGQDSKRWHEPFSGHKGPTPFLIHLDIANVNRTNLNWTIWKLCTPPYTKWSPALTLCLLVYLKCMNKSSCQVLDNSWIRWKCWLFTFTRDSASWHAGIFAIKNESASIANVPLRYCFYGGHDRMALSCSYGLWLEVVGCNLARSGNHSLG